MTYENHLKNVLRIRGENRKLKLISLDHCDRIPFVHEKLPLK